MRLVSIVALVRWRDISAEKSWMVEKGRFYWRFLEDTRAKRGVLVVRTWWDAW
jgi:hypothetical protein